MRLRGRRQRPLGQCAGEHGCKSAREHNRDDLRLLGVRMAFNNQLAPGAGLPPHRQFSGAMIIYMLPHDRRCSSAAALLHRHTHVLNAAAVLREHPYCTAFQFEE
jgi:hypothetical protein